MTGIVSFPRQITVSYGIEDVSGIKRVRSVLYGPCALDLRREFDPITGSSPYRVFLEGFGYPLEVFLNQIQPYMTWQKLTITPRKGISASQS